MQTLLNVKENSDLFLLRGVATRSGLDKVDDGVVETEKRVKRDN